MWLWFDRLLLLYGGDLGYTSPVFYSPGKYVEAQSVFLYNFINASLM